ncbi:fibrillin-2 isoform X4 [Strongylocentrotus purpuratus]|uniref:Uncharacterized protein n=1 Tax=Strongylocentrotus purpuratus TaxID=7668 RepID=A0A7M7NA36_STRPU|nr:fibrillin-2 isoform X4 [Strongylocentrotus purpuratus]
MLRSSLLVLLVCLSTVVVAQSNVINGPNVCGMRFYSYCCPGWRLHPRTKQCVVPVCNRPCGSGYCQRPNSCSCPGGQISVSGCDGYSGGNPCTTQCLNGGSCQGNSCNCPNGFSGTNCGMPTCNPPCQNGGECSGGNRCSCPPGFGGSQCQTDYRTGVCYLQSTSNGYCSAGVEGLHCTKALCCATIGQGWGDPCENCDTFDNPCDRGYILNGRTGQCIDADECLMIPGLCDGGQCTNTQGSYACQCPAGFELSMSTLSCVDMNECQTGYLCQNGRCINTQGSFRCDCNPGYFLGQDGHHCTDIDTPNTPVTPEEIGYCYMRFRNRNSRGTSCSQELAVRMSFLDCCCSVDHAEGWGLSRSDCSPCRTENEELYRRLCEGVGELTTPQPRRTPNPQTRTDGPGVVTLTPPTVTPPRKITPRPEGICLMVPNICRNGLCVSLGGVMEYRCECFEGYENAGRYTCQDINECRDRSLCRYGACENTDGSFRCVCPSGYKLSLDQRSCEDVDECRTNPNVCHHGTCMNIVGSHTCDCFEGYQKSIDGRYCIDVDECTLGSHRCRNAECENLPGTYECICTEGYEAIGSSGVCIDVNECAQETNPCPLGFCINTLGGYQCQCPVGYATGQDGTCVENRRGFCFLDGDLGRCTHQSMGQMTISSCCCSAVLLQEALSWGPNCESCPPQGTLQFEQLCKHGTGWTSQRININECTLFNNLCDNGVCEDLTGNYKCRCNSGFQPQADGKECIDENECSYNRLLCHNGACRNTPGSFVCECPDGYELDARSSVCQDVNECQNPSLCNNGRCINTRGSYRCECIYPGTELDPTGTICVDNRIATCWTRISNGQCEADIMGPMRRDECCSTFGRAWGSPCEACPLAFGDCPRGFSEINSECVDLNECELNPMVCNNGLCENTMGSYRCVCEEGLTLDTSGRNCVDLRSYECFLDYSEGQCSSPIPGLYRNSVCCCSLGYSYGDQGRCYECPQEGSVEFDVLCPRGRGFADTRPRPDLLDGTVYINDINECNAYDGICKYGECTNIIGSYDCVCDVGFAMDEFGYQCVDIDECRITFGACGNGSCENTPGDFRCNCYEGFEAHPVMRSCMDINECETVPGLCRGGSCTNLPGMFRCDCPLGQELTPDGQACRDINECSISTGICSNGECHNIVGTYRCMCNPGFRPTANYRACEDMNECDMDNGGCDHNCVNSQGSYECQCQSGYSLRVNGRTCVDIDECADNPDICGGGQCENQEGGYLCDCFVGFRPADDFRSCLDIDECSTDAGVCVAGVCKNTRGSFTCQCFEGYSMKPGIPGCSDIDECMLQMHQCAINSQCENTIGSFQCRCNPGFIVDENANICIDVDECESSNHDCHEDARCVNIPGSYQCQCNQGFIGDGLSCIDVDECRLIDGICANGICVNTPGSFRCDCQPGYRANMASHICEDIDECFEGMHRCVGNSICRNTPGNHECICPPGYQLSVSRLSCDDINECLTRPGTCINGQCTNQIGSFVCVCDQGFQLSADGTQCNDIDECFRFPDRCGNGTCQNVVGDFACSCNRGFELTINGDCADINECATMQGTCPNGRCVNTPGSFFCDCVEGYVLSLSGLRCEDENECISRLNICQNGRCDNTIGSFRCSCFDGFQLSPSGQECIDTDECVIIPDMCRNGVCQNTQGSFQCTCPPGYLLSSDGLICIDMRRSYCYNDFVGGQCTDARAGNATRKECCCSLGAGWSSPCNLCPRPSDASFTELCPDGPGYAPSLTPDLYEDINECKVFPGICENGICINTDGSYRCQCQPGFILDTTGRICVDRNECQENYNVCGFNSTCYNTLGSFECNCGEGYQVGRRGTCEDINECRRRRGQCAFRCQNLPGSFRCLCPNGYTLTDDGRHCRDLDECDTNLNTCRYRCKNLIGKFMCQCDEGYTPIGGDGNNCRDINECITNHGVCQNGRCRNTEGGHTCICNQGFTLGPSGKDCIDRRTGFCYAYVPPSGCESSQGGMQPVTMESCCCSGGRAWGSTCQICPVYGTIEYNRLCTATTPVDPCQIVQGLCENGHCLGGSGGYLCQCNPGYILSPDGTRCEDENECNRVPPPCSYQCKNTPGSFRCGCPQGYLLSEDGLTCREKDECSMGIHECQFECRNTLGGFRCVCPEGYIQHGSTCIDVNECIQTPDICGAYGTCQNTQGGHRCECQRNFRPDPSTNTCVDINECEDQPDICQYGCQNTIGGYRCVCPDGFEENFYGRCIDNNECRQSGKCGQATCYNTQGSYQCGCNNGYAFDQQNLACNDVNECQGSYGNTNSPCQYSCDNTDGSFSCGCPPGYTSVVQGACVTDRDSVQPCYSCNRQPRQRRSATETNDKESTMISNNTAILYHIPLSKAVPKQQIAKFKTGYTRVVARYEYVILSGNEDNIFMMKKKSDGMSLLRFSKHVKATGLYELEIEGVLKRKNDTILAEVQTVVEEPVAMQIQVQIVADEEE